MCSFSPSGKLLASVQLEESIIAFWTPTSNFMTSIVSAFSHETLKPVRTCHLGPPQKSISLEKVMAMQTPQWTSERSVVFKTPDMELVFNV